MGINNIIKIKPYEKTIVVVRRHFITFIPNMAFFILLFLVPPIVYWLIYRLFPSIIITPTIYVVSVLLASIYYLSMMLFFYTSFIEFYLDLSIITNDRIIDVNQATLFSRKITEADLYQVQDASSEIKGFFPSLFNYGTVEIQTAGTIPKFILEDVPSPNHLRQMILEIAAE